MRTPTWQTRRTIYLSAAFDEIRRAHLRRNGQKKKNESINQTEKSHLMSFSVRLAIDFIDF